MLVSHEDHVNRHCGMREITQAIENYNLQSDMVHSDDCREHLSGDIVSALCSGHTRDGTVGIPYWVEDPL
jgi:hypothetical protein